MAGTRGHLCTGGAYRDTAHAAEEETNVRMQWHCHPYHCRNGSQTQTQTRARQLFPFQHARSRLRRSSLVVISIDNIVLSDSVYDLSAPTPYYDLSTLLLALS